VAVGSECVGRDEGGGHGGVEEVVEGLDGGELLGEVVAREGG